MELIKKNIHMEQTKCRGTSQLTLEEDVNISDQKPDAARLISEKGNIVIEELRPQTDYVTVKGALEYAALYLTDEKTRYPQCLEGKISFEEKIYLEGVGATDSVQIKTELEDLSLSLINSRKLSVRALVDMEVFVSELYDEEAIVEIVNAPDIEIRKIPMSVTTLAVDTRDIFRIKEEVELANGMPNFFELLWKDIRVQGMEIKPGQDKLQITGELAIFFLYEGEGEDRPVRYYEITRPISGAVNVAGCHESMIPDISYEIEHEDIEIHPDLDGEERILQIDLALSMTIRLMETQEIGAITDVYGITQDIEPVRKEGCCRSLLQRATGKLKLSDTLKVGSQNPHILQICHVNGTLLSKQHEINENGVDLSGLMLVKALYVTGDDEYPFACVNGSIPYHYHLDVPGIHEECSIRVLSQIDQLGGTMVDGEEMEIKAVLSFYVMVFEGERESILSDVAVLEPDKERKEQSPAMVLYIARENDSIWNLGKKYNVSLNAIREINHLSQDELQAGDKILVVKEMI